MSSLGALPRRRTWLHSTVALAAVAAFTLLATPGQLLAHGQATNEDTRKFLKALAAAIPALGDLAGNKLDGDYCVDPVPNGAVVCAPGQASVKVDLDNRVLNLPVGGSLPELPEGVDPAQVRVSSISITNLGLLGTLPVSWGQMTSLTALTLSENELTGPLPSEYSGLTDLDTLSVGQNQLSGSLPSSYRALYKLRLLILSNNQFAGRLPASWGSGMTFLMPLLGLSMASAGQFCGCVPASWTTNDGMSSAISSLPDAMRDADCAMNPDNQCPEPPTTSSTTTITTTTAPTTTSTPNNGADNDVDHHHHHPRSHPRSCGAYVTWRTHF